MSNKPLNIKIIKGDLLALTPAQAQVIVQQTNCTSKTGAGLAAAITSKFPYADMYKGRTEPSMPGTIKIVGNPAANKRYVGALFAQYFPGAPSKKGLPSAVVDELEVIGENHDSTKAREYWFKRCLNALGAVKLGGQPIKSVAFPMGIGSGLAKGNWCRYKAMIGDFAKKFPAIRVLIVDNGTFAASTDTSDTDTTTASTIAKKVSVRKSTIQKTVKKKVPTASPSLLAAANTAGVKRILFYSEKEDYGYMSNYWGKWGTPILDRQWKLVIDGKEWPTTEHYFQAMKFRGQACLTGKNCGAEYMEYLRQSNTPNKAKGMGNMKLLSGFQANLHLAPKHPQKINDIIRIYRDNRKLTLRPDWDAVRERIMYKAVFEKFRQNPHLKRDLLSTGNAILVEHSKDAIWGDGLDGSGQNLLGKTLMRVRTALRGNAPVAKSASKSMQKTVVAKKAVVKKAANRPQSQAVIKNVMPTTMRSEDRHISYIRHAKPCYHPNSGGHDSDPPIVNPTQKIKQMWEYDLIICSPYLRCRQTAAAANVRGVPIKIDPRIAEYWPPTKGRLLVKKSTNEAAKKSGLGGLPIKESWEDFSTRVDAHYRDMLKKYKDKNVLVITHGLVVKYLQERVMGVEMFKRGRDVPYLQGFTVGAAWQVPNKFKAHSQQKFAEMSE